jgi:glyoxylase-like metal-dependent hydrolase (beta-lactamase superfamily II)
VTRILGQNPSLFTLQGTNTYFLQPSTSPSAPIILVDTTMPTTADAWVKQVMDHLNSLASPPPPIQHLILTHRHIDHVGGFGPLLTALRDAGAPPLKVWKFPNPDEVALQNSEREMDVYSTDGAIHDRLSAFPSQITPFTEKNVVHPLAEGTHISVEHDGETVGVTVVTTPGHTADSISLLVDGPDKAVITGDTILGQGTTIFQDFAACELKASVLPAHTET